MSRSEENPVFTDGEIARILDDLADSLGRLMAPTEAAFLNTGNILAQSRTALDTVGVDFRDLSSRLGNQESATAVANLATAREETIRVSSEIHSVASGLTGLSHAAAAVNSPLGVLERIISEIASLATNAKIQAAQVTATDVDFTVFTKEIDRLRLLAQDTVKRAVVRLLDLTATIGSAASAAQDFQRDGAHELNDVAARLKESLTAWTQRQSVINDAMTQFEGRTRGIGEKIARCIGALQINDLTSQRIDHVRQALIMLRTMLHAREQRDLDTGNEWVLELSAERKRHLSAAVCELQARQLDLATADFATAISDLRSAMAALAEDAAAIPVQARQVYGDGNSRHSFLHDVAADVDRATTLLETYCQADDKIRAQIVNVSEGFSAVTEDLRSIHSIDADMRIMGLNATFKCSRLGRSGVALGVIAQELRACSRRTEETSRSISSAISAATRQASDLADRSGQEHAAAASLAANMASSMNELRRLGEDMERSLSGLIGICTDIAKTLGKSAQDIAMDAVLSQAAAKTVDQLHHLSKRIAPEGINAEAVHDDIRRMLQGRYTMASERVIHNLFAEGETEASASEGTTSDDIDDCFF